MGQDALQKVLKIYNIQKINKNYIDLIARLGFLDYKFPIIC